MLPPLMHLLSPALLDISQMLVGPHVFSAHMVINARIRLPEISCFANLALSGTVMALALHAQQVNSAHLPSLELEQLERLALLELMHLKEVLIAKSADLATTARTLQEQPMDLLAPRDTISEVMLAVLHVQLTMNVLTMRPSFTVLYISTPMPLTTTAPHVPTVTNAMVSPLSLILPSNAQPVTTPSLLTWSAHLVLRVTTAPLLELRLQPSALVVPSLTWDSRAVRPAQLGITPSKAQSTAHLFQKGIESTMPVMD